MLVRLPLEFIRYLMLITFVLTGPVAIAEDLVNGKTLDAKPAVQKSEQKVGDQEENAGT